MTDPREGLASQALELARSKLGPASATALRDPRAMALVLHRLRAGFELEDAVLGVLHGEATSSRAIADEFLAFFGAALRAAGHERVSPELRRTLDTADLVQSVLGDLWPELGSLRFETRREFAAYLKRRLRWKASDKSRAASSARRREDLRVSDLASAPDPAAHEPSPSSLAGLREESERLARALERLRGRDRELVERHLRGESIEQLAAALDLERDTARKALQRALARLRGE